MSSKIIGRSVLIAGGSGVFGQHLIEDLIERGAQPDHIHVLDLKLNETQKVDVRFHHGNISCVDDVRKVLQLVNPSVIFHTASPYPFESDHAVLERVNIDGTRNLVQLSHEIGSVLAFVYTSSSSVVHDYYHPLRRADESYPVLHFPQQPNYYSHSKAVAEEIVLSANGKGSNMLSVAIRPASMYGEGDKTQIPSLVKTARAGRANMRIGPEENNFDNTYIKNLSLAEILAAGALLAANEGEAVSNDKRVQGEAFFVTDDDSYSFPAYTRLVARFAGHPVDPSEVRTIPFWLILSLVYAAGCVYWVVTFGKEMAFSTKVVRTLAQERTFYIEKAKTRLGYKPRFTTAEGTKRAVEWFIEHESKWKAEKKSK
ncbi:C-3 sterol dehydrogenase/C-4 decarboxylase family protein [Pyrenochaeta sp. DS3sAY3a]|nr:C-3 sterol dehydrogenase/C-4 decarboxylase family protein [Pyrenochaeta sp. DS3sAY3a]